MTTSEPLQIDRPADLDELVAAVGSAGLVVALGSGSHQDVGGVPDAAARRVVAPAGVRSYDPAEMTVRCSAGTTVAELDEVLGAAGQMCPLDPVDRTRTVGGVLGLGRSGPRRLRHGPIRDLVLQVRFVSAWGELSTAGGPTVKNVSGFDLCRLLVGSLGTLGVLGEVVLRCLPRPPEARWFAGTADPFALRDRLHRPSSILWDGTTTWLLLEGSAAEVRAEATVAGLDEVAGPPPMPSAGRRSVRPRELRDLRGSFLAEVGVGVVHLDGPVAGRPAPAEVLLHDEVKRLLDPDGRFAPGRELWGDR
ncbi:MAG: FAD-binding protein [Actinomycetota bacterium]